MFLSNELINKIILNYLNNNNNLNDIISNKFGIIFVFNIFKKKFIENMNKIQPDEEEKIIGPKTEKNQTSQNNETRKISEYIYK